MLTISVMAVSYSLPDTNMELESPPVAGAVSPVGAGSVAAGSAGGAVVVGGVGAPCVEVGALLGRGNTVSLKS